MTQQPEKKQSRKQSQPLPNTDPQFLAIYDRTTCQRCPEPMSKRRLKSLMKRKFWPVCKKCEPWVVAKYKEGVEKMAHLGEGFF